MGNVSAKVVGNIETNHVTESWRLKSLVRYANELNKMAVLSK